MKKPLIFLLVLACWSVCSFAQTTDKEVAQIKAQISKIRSEITRLKAKKIATASKANQVKIQETMDGHQARIDKLVKQLAAIEAEKLRLLRLKEQGAVGQPVESATPAEGSEEAVEAIETIPEVSREGIAEQPGVSGPPQQHRFNFQIGGTAGMYASATAYFGEARFPLSYIFGAATSSLRFSGGYAQTSDMSRRYAPVAADVVLNFPAGWFTGVDNYLGAGLNYVVLTSGQKAGSYGGQLFYGIESGGFGGKLFGEMGLAMLRTGFSPSYRGTTLLFGYRTEWGLL